MRPTPGRACTEDGGLPRQSLRYNIGRECQGRECFDAVFELIDDKNWRVPAITPGAGLSLFSRYLVFGAVPTARKRAAALERL